MATEMNVEAERAAFEAWFAAGRFGGMKESMWAAWEARAAQPANVGAGELPDLPEMDGPSDIAYVLDTPAEWDDDYRKTWQQLQVAQRNKMQWRAYALALRAQLARQSQGVKPYAYEYGKSNGDGTYSVVIDRGDLVQVAERKYEYGPPKNAMKDRPVMPLYAAPPLSSEQQDPPINQCDGCRQGAPMTSLGNHIDSNGKPFMYCQKQRYESVGERQAEKEEGA